MENLNQKKWTNENATTWTTGTGDVYYQTGLVTCEAPQNSVMFSMADIAAMDKQE